MQQAKAGFFKRIWIALAGEQDPVKAQLKEMSKQGAGIARVANTFAFVLVILFSLVSLITLANSDFASVITGWRHHTLEVQAGIFTLIVPVLVLCMDFAMLYAASMIRRLIARHSGLDEKLVHYAVMWGVVVLEAGTYIYAASVYEHPHDLIAWNLIIWRAIFAPLLAVYLSMAKAIPVSPRDILHQGELILGISILKSVTDLANNPDAKLGDKLEMFRAVTIASEPDLKRLGNLITLASGTSQPIAVPAIETPKVPPTNGGQRVDISPIVPDEVEDDDTTGYTQPDLRIARYTPDSTYHNGKKLRQHRNYNTMRQQVYDLLNDVGLDEKGRPGLTAPQVARELKMKDIYAADIRNQWWREQIASLRGTDISLPDSLDEGEVDEVSGLWVAR